MGKRNKSKRFVQQGRDVIAQHDLKIPYHMTYAEAESMRLERGNSPAGGLL